MEVIKVRVPPDHTGAQRTNYSAFANNSKKVLTVINSNSELSHTATIMATGANFADYSTGGPAPLEGDRVTQVKVGLSKIKAEGFSGTAALEVLMQSITIFQAYASVYEAIQHESIKDYLPFNGVLFPLASLYLKFGELLVLIEKWQLARGTENEKASVVDVVGAVASCLLYAAQIFVFLSATKLAITFQAALSTVIYASTFFQLFNSEFNAEDAMRKNDHTRPTVRLKV
ncbi:MAG: hypothetical protein H7A38_02390 [Chlamydiales bacterium]|nr:hypothetical protein [Chlamydiales bacterium]